MLAEIVTKYILSPTDIDECLILKKYYGSCGGESKCIDGINGYTCECAEGWEVQFS